MKKLLIFLSLTVLFACTKENITPQTTLKEDSVRIQLYVYLQPGDTVVWNVALYGNHPYLVGGNGRTINNLTLKYNISPDGQNDSQFTQYYINNPSTGYNDSLHYDIFVNGKNVLHSNGKSSYTFSD